MSVYTFNTVRSSICSKRIANKLLKKKKEWNTPIDYKYSGRNKTEMFGNKAGLVSIAKSDLDWQELPNQV